MESCTEQYYLSTKQKGLRSGQQWEPDPSRKIAFAKRKFRCEMLAKKGYTARQSDISE